MASELERYSKRGIKRNYEGRLMIYVTNLGKNKTCIDRFPCL